MPQIRKPGSNPKKRERDLTKIANSVAEGFVGRTDLTPEQRIMIRNKMKEISLHSPSFNEEVIEAKKSLKFRLILDNLTGTDYFFPLSKFLRKFNSVNEQVIKLRANIQSLNKSIEIAKKKAVDASFFEKDKKLIEENLASLTKTFIQLISFRDGLIASNNPQNFLEENKALLDHFFKK
ncbi:MAG: hypothetical protein JW703_01305 [Candidatus Diapherotrites archaeon]|nr:hypothetical protein [Candidatus Diapherotrites archaeon]